MPTEIYVLFFRHKLPDSRIFFNVFAGYTYTRLVGVENLTSIILLFTMGICILFRVMFRLIYMLFIFYIKIELIIFAFSR